MRRIRECKDPHQQFAAKGFDQGRENGDKVADEASDAVASSRPIRTLIPGHKPIELVAYYLSHVDYYPECELQTKRWFVENVRSDWVMFDVGANIGYYSILFSRLAPAGQIFAFEPTETFFMLKENLAHHGCSNVTAMQTALGVVSGAIEDGIFRVWGNEPERRTYDFSTIDDLTRSLELTRLDGIKIDVDSFDFEVLMGAEQTLKRFNPWVVVELCHALSRRGHSVQEALEWLISKGYRKSHVLDQTSFVLHRDRESLNRDQSEEPSIRLTFESRPVILPPPWIKGTPIENPFVSEPLAHNQSKIVANHADGKVSVDVRGPRWAYACSWRRLDDGQIREPFLIELKMQVSGGSVGLGCVVSDLTRYVGKEKEVAPSSELQTICLYVENHIDARNLILRNIDLAGHDAQVTIHELSCFTAAKPI